MQRRLASNEGLPWLSCRGCAVAVLLRVRLATGWSKSTDDGGAAGVITEGADITGGGGGGRAVVVVVARSGEGVDWHA